MQELLFQLASRAQAWGGVYLEVGCYRGKTLLAAAMSGAPCYGVEDYSQHQLGERIPIQQLRRELHSNVARYSSGNITLIEKPFQHYFALADVPPIAVYFYDGAHDYESQVEALVGVRKHLVDGAIVVVDDACIQWPDEATRYVLEHEPRYTPVRRIEAPRGAEGFWNGLWCLQWHKNP